MDIDFGVGSCRRLSARTRWGAHPHISVTDTWRMLVHMDTFVRGIPVLSAGHLQVEALVEAATIARNNDTECAPFMAVVEKIKEACGHDVGAGGAMAMQAGFLDIVARKDEIGLTSDMVQGWIDALAQIQPPLVGIETLKADFIMEVRCVSLDCASCCVVLLPARYLLSSLTHSSNRSCTSIAAAAFLPPPTFHYYRFGGSSTKS